MKRIATLIMVLLLVVLSAQSAFSLVITWRSDSPWNPAWPKQLEPFRRRAKVHGVAHGIQETVFEIPFSDRSQFEKAWPIILKLKSPGAPLILEKAPCRYHVSGSQMGAGIRVLWPSGGTCRKPGGKALQASAPWPESIKSPSGELPEYVVAAKDMWVPFLDESQKGFRNRARVDIVLVADGEIVDLNRIPLPADTSIIDRRFDKP